MSDSVRRLSCLLQRIIYKIVSLRCFTFSYTVIALTHCSFHAFLYETINLYFEPFIPIRFPLCSHKRYSDVYKLCFLCFAYIQDVRFIIRNKSALILLRPSTVNVPCLQVTYVDMWIPLLIKNDLPLVLSSLIRQLLLMLMIMLL
jgi:hypothetical protein